MTTPESRWISAFAEQLGVEPPDDDLRDAILALAGTAAHASQRTAAPLACWLAATSNLNAHDALRLALTIPPTSESDDER
ncbi:MAG: hypothetical protein KGI14_06250 [Acidobacteriota bacterium]|nr:hypothetical protein [Acidobacteriota bacterium]